MTPKELEKYIKTCRKLGVSELTIEGVTFKLGDEPQAKVAKSGPRQTTYEDTAAMFESDTLTDEALLMWSVSGGNPYVDPGAQ